MLMVLIQCLLLHLLLLLLQDELLLLMMMLLLLLLLLLLPLSHLRHVVQLHALRETEGLPQPLLPLLLQPLQLLRRRRRRCVVARFGVRGLLRGAHA